MTRQNLAFLNDSEFNPRKKKIKVGAVSQPVGSSALRNFKVKEISPLNEAQRQMMLAFVSGSHIIAEGSAGTGKSYVGLYLALSSLINKDVSSVKIIRSAVPTRSVGFLPGSLAEKNEVYELPYKDIVNDLMECGTAYEMLSKKGAIEFQTTSYLRGLTFNNCVILVDEAQGMTFHEINTIATRIGKNCRLIVCGDTKQCDLTGSRDISGFDKLKKIASKMSGAFDVCTFTKHDIVRSEFVKRWITEVEEND
jgi:phosphate starvation-inducible PhoH-like protein